MNGHDKAACPVPSARDDFPRVAFHARPIEGLPSDVFERDCAAALDEIDRLRAELTAVQQSRQEWQRKAIESEAAMFNMRRAAKVNTDGPVSS